jgi:hypothetical protein
MPRALLLAALTLSLSACSLQSVAVSHEAGYPSEYEIADAFSGDPVAFFNADRSRVDIVVFASSTCDLIPTSIDSSTPTEIAVSFVKPGGGCAQDVSATTFTFVTPEAVSDADVTATVTVGATDWTIPVSDYPAND